MEPRGSLATAMVHTCLLARSKISDAASGVSAFAAVRSNAINCHCGIDGDGVPMRGARLALSVCGRASIIVLAGGATRSGSLFVGRHRATAPAACWM